MVVIDHHPIYQGYRLLLNMYDFVIGFDLLDQAKREYGLHWNNNPKSIVMIYTIVT